MSLTVPDAVTDLVKSCHACVPFVERKMKCGNCLVLARMWHEAKCHIMREGPLQMALTGLQPLQAVHAWKPGMLQIFNSCLQGECGSSSDTWIGCWELSKVPGFDKCGQLL